MNGKRVLSFLAVIFILLGAGVAARDTLKLKIVSYQPPAGLIQYLSEAAPADVSYKQSEWVGISEADIILYFMSNSDARHEIPIFGSEILETIDFDPESSAIVTQSIAHGSRVIYAVYVFSDMFGGSSDEIKCYTANTIATLTLKISGSQVVELRDC